MKKNLIILEDITAHRQHMVRGGGFPVTRFGLYLVLIVCIFMFQMLTGCATLKLTPVASPPTEVYHQGQFVWHDLLTSDVATAKNFYGELFGWSFKKQGRYTVVLNKGQPIGGMIEVQPKDGKKHAARWLASLSVPDVDKAAALVQKAGGTVHEGPVDMKNRGRSALVSDPQGAQLLLLHSSVGDPEDKEPPMGSWLWIELWSNDPEKAIAFYKELVGYSPVDLKEDYWLLWKDKWRGGVRLLLNEDLGIRWTPSVRVPDTVSISERVEKLGGQVLVQPRDVSIGSGSVALIEDPAGALLIVQRWSKQSFSKGD
ncbi:MAG: VOC family protein [Deltaproteobacteria bacterium]|nr:VOC family protein [Deltaproteobacteria bacterium]